MSSIAANVYESSYIVNSFFAIDKDTKQVIACDGAGFISPAQGTTIVFYHPYQDIQVDVNTLTIEAGDEPVLIQLNDLERYPLYVGANERKQIVYMRIYSITALSGGSFYYEGLSSDT